MSDVGPLRHVRMAHSGECEDDGPNQPAHPEEDAERNQQTDGRPRDPFVCSRRYRVNNMSAIELPARQEVERGGKHSYPRCDTDRVQIKRAQWRVTVGQRGQEMMKHVKDQRIPELQS